MSSMEIEKPFEDEDAALNFTQGIRKRLVNQITVNGIPGHEETQRLLLDTLKGIDGAALGRLRIKADEKANNNQAAAQALIAQVLAKVSTGSAYKVEKEVPREIPTIPSDVTAEIVPGELDTNPAQMNYDSFMNQFNND